ncbi:L-threonylcarbamoyladenylate synthase [Porticoccus sp.]
MNQPHLPSLHIARAVSVLCRGGVIAYPTEAVWGLGCDPFNQQAVSRLLALKRRRREMGLIMIAASMEQFEPFLAGLPPVHRRQLQDSWPGPQTWLVPNNGRAPCWVSGGRDTLALRVTDHPVAAALCRAFGGPLVSTSANPHGRPPAGSRLKVELYFHGLIDVVVPGSLGGLPKPTPIKHLVSGELVRSG